ncbi:hypothetical protein OIU84_004310 [Salix udensis]|uniref:Early-responsive to dehydration stress protein n=1 Tax=Salix udensis TaxID=889485 RepID=A0AAD6K299_9ROSI|nr:hypothetical protein OIU84_004310 [Salix udensis]
MATLQDIGVSALINVLGAFAFLLAFALLRVQPINDRVYFPKWYISGGRSSPRRAGNSVGKLVNLDIKTSFTFLNWMPQALKMSEAEIINHAGLDSAVFLRIYTLGLKIFVPITILALVILIPVNVSNGTLFFLRKELVMSNIDKLSISNVRPRSIKFFIHIALQYAFTIWTCFMLYKEYDHVASMRLHFLASQRRHAEQFTVVVRNVPHVSGRSVLDTAEQFFKKNHPNTYLCQQAVYNANKFAKLVRKRDRLQNWLDYNQLKSERHPDKRPTRKKGFLGIWGERVDSIEYYKQQIKLLEKNMASERQKKPRDIYWRNLAIPFVSLTVRKLIISLSVFALVFFYMIPIAFVQSLANLEGLERVAPFLRPVIELKLIKSFLQGFLPGLALKIFLYILPTVLMVMSKVEGYIAHSALERRAAAKYYYFMLVNVFLGSIIAGTAFEQLDAFLHQSPTQIPRTIGVSIPMKATFFITYIMVDGWAGIAGEILRLKPLIIFHLKNMFLVKTERDREKAMNPGSVGFPKTLPRLQLYFLLGIVYAVVTPILLPFILVFFAFAYLAYRHQIVNVYNQQYESAAAFWPHVHSLILPILTLSFHNYCKSRFEPAFRKYPLEATMEKDILDRTTESDINLKAYLADAYLHPIFHSFEEEELVEVNVERNKSHTASDPTTEISSSSPPHQVSHPRSPPPHYVYHPSSPPQHAYHPHSPPHYAYHYENEP